MFILYRIVGIISTYCPHKNNPPGNAQGIDIGPQFRTYQISSVITDLEFTYNVPGSFFNQGAVFTYCNLSVFKH